MKKKFVLPAVLVLAAAACVGCSSATQTATLTSVEKTPAFAVAAVGSLECGPTHISSTPMVNGVAYVTKSVTCTSTNSDPRVAGTVTFVERAKVVAGTAAHTIRPVQGSAEIVNVAGRWVASYKVDPAPGDTEQFAFAGMGRYAGLTYITTWNTHSLAGATSGAIVLNPMPAP